MYVLYSVMQLHKNMSYHQMSYSVSVENGVQDVTDNVAATVSYLPPIKESVWESLRPIKTPKPNPNRIDYSAKACIGIRVLR